MRKNGTGTRGRGAAGGRLAFAAAASAFGIVAATGAGAGAAPVTWNGPAGNSWGSGASWSNGSGPAAGDSAFFGDAGSTNLPGEVTSVLNGSRTIGGLTFSNTINKYHTLEIGRASRRERV